MSPIMAVDDSCVTLAERFVARLELEDVYEARVRARMVAELAALLQNVGNDAIDAWRLDPPKAD